MVRQSVAMLGVLLLMTGCVFSYPAMEPEQDYLEYLAEQAASRGRDLFGRGARGGGGIPDAFDVLYGSEKDYPAAYKALAIQALEQQMNRGMPGAELAEEESTVWNGRLTELAEWDAGAEVGQVGGVAVCPEGFPHVFHRADRTWDSDTFDANNVLNDRTPIQNNTVLTLNAETGEVVDAWGAGTFYMPHGLTIDDHGNLWFTDVGLHQVLKFSPEKKLLMTLGVAFEPAKGENDNHRFCEPTQVAVASNGDFFVADGYCNRRVVKYHASGKYLGEFGAREGLQVPHSLALLEKYDAICVADRENERIVCFGAGLRDADNLGEVLRTYDDERMGRVYSIAYSPEDDLLYGVGLGEETGGEYTTPLGFTIDVSEEQGYYTDIVNSWAPSQGFSFPHAMAISPDGENVYVGELNGDHHLWKFVKEEQAKEEVEQELEDEASEDHEEEDAEEEEEEVEEEDNKAEEEEEKEEEEKKEEDKKDAE